MKYFLRKLFNWESTYLVKVEYNKHGGKSYPNLSKSKKHLGNKINNQYMDLLFEDTKPLSLALIIQQVKETHKNASNIEIISINKID